MSGPISSVYILAGVGCVIMLSRLEKERQEAEAAAGFNQLKEAVAAAEVTLREACGTVRQKNQYETMPIIALDEAEQVLKRLGKVADEIVAGASGRSPKQLQLCRQQAKAVITAAAVAAETVRQEAEELQERLKRGLVEQIAQQINIGGAQPDPVADVPVQAEKPLEISRPAGEEAKRTQLRIQIEVELNALAALPLGAGIRKQLEQLRTKLQKIGDVKFLRNYYTISVLPFIGQCEQYRQEYDELMATNHYYSERLGLIPEISEFSETGIRHLKAHVDMLRRKVEKQAEQEYIAAAMDEVMAELGYDVLGRCQVQKRNGRQFEHKLYHFSPGTAVNVTSAPNGQISMELGGLEDEERQPTPPERQALAEEMEVFCDEFREIERRLKARGIVPGNRLSMLPPRPEYARLINTAEYEMVRRTELYERVRKTKPETNEQVMRKE